MPLLPSLQDMCAGVDLNGRGHVEKGVRDLLADVDSPKAHRHIRETLRLNKFTSFLMLVALVAPVTALVSFYGAKAGAIREVWLDPYELPPGFDPNVSGFDPSKNPTKGANLPAAFVLKVSSDAHRAT